LAQTRRRAEPPKAKTGETAEAADTVAAEEAPAEERAAEESNQ
jgi:hypothetical protein